MEKKPLKRKLFACGRLFVQAVSLLLTLAGSVALVRHMGLPTWAFLVVVALAGLFFCGWMCPFGTIQEWLRHVGKSATGITIRIPERVDRYLLFSRYVLLALGGVLVLSLFDSKGAFLAVLAGRGVEAAAYVVLGAILLLSLFMDRPFCRYFCDFGALMGLASVLRVFTIRRDDGKCVGCRACNRSCLMGVEVAKAHAVRDPNCINCGKCVSACPVPGALRPAVSLPCRADLTALREKYRPGKQAYRTPAVSETARG